MPWAISPLSELTLLWTEVAAAALAGLFLGLECFASRGLASRAPGVVGGFLLLVSGAAAAIDGGTRIAGGGAILAAFYLLLWAASLPEVRVRLGRWLTPRVLWTAALLGSLMASRYAATRLLASVENASAAEALEIADVPVAQIEARTDEGLAIPLFHYALFMAPEEAERLFLAAAPYEGQAIRLAAPSSAANCHGWVFAGGKYGIRNPDVPAILADNDYEPIEAVQPGDLAVYEAAGAITHTGIVRFVNPGGVVLIESKWGPFGVFLHAAAAQPFSGACRYYRSPRTGHSLTIRRHRAGSAPQAAG